MKRSASGKVDGRPAGSRRMDWAAEFPGLHAQTYLNSCAHGLLPRRTRRAIEAHLDQWERAPDWAAWSESVEAARKAFARLIGARDDEVAVQANATSGIAAVMNTVTKGRIATTDIDFPTSGFVAQRQTTRGIQHEHLEEGALRVDAWAPKAKGAALACIPAVASFSGYRLDVPSFAARAKEMDVPLLVDAFQACGTYPIDVRKWDVDFLVTGVYKWLLAPAGLAFLYVRRDHHARLPTTSGWYAAADSYAFDPLGEMAADARRYQYGGPSVVSCVALVESLKLLDEVGLASVERTNRALVERILARCAERKYEVLTPEAPEARASIVTFRVPHLERALAACQRENVVVNSRLGGIRVSPHFYNRAEDVDRLFAVLDRAG